MISIFRRHEDDVERYYKERQITYPEEDEDSERGIIAVFKKLLYLAMICIVLYVSIRGAYIVINYIFEHGKDEYGFLSREVEDVCSVVWYNDRVYLITDAEYNGYLSMISGCIDFDENDNSIDVYEDGGKNYIKHSRDSYVRSIEYTLKEHEGMYYMELSGDAYTNDGSFGSLIVEGVFRELLEGYDGMLGGNN